MKLISISPSIFLSFFINNVEEALDQMRYIVTDEEYKLIKKSNIKIIYLHARECIEQLSLGNIDVGFSGIDLLKESEIKEKSPGNFVTIVDLEAEAFLKKKLIYRI